LQLAEVHIGLGDLGLDGTDVESALSDMQKAIALRQRFLPPHDRRIAESHMLFGMALQAIRDYRRAGQPFKDAIGVLELAIAHHRQLQPAGASLDSADDQDVIEELQGLIGEVQERFREAEAFASVLEKKRAPNAAAEEGSSSAFDAPAFPPTSAVHDLSASIVKKPRQT
jgi:hypothetical protein